MKKLKAVTLLELLIAMSLLSLIMFAAGGIYLSGWRMFRDAQFQAQAQRNAMVAMAHMEKHLREAQEFYVMPAVIPGDGVPTTTSLYFRVYPAPPNFPAGPTTISSYTWYHDTYELEYNPDTSLAGDEQIIGRHIHGFTRTITHENWLSGGALVDISITSRDNSDLVQNSCVLTSSVEARYGSVPSVY